MSATLTLYTNPQSRGRIARWMMEEIGQPYELELIPYGPPMKTEQYRAINPMGKVPALKHGKHVVTECAAICAYMAETFPEAGLAPTAEERADYYRWLFFAAGPVEAAITNRSMGVEIPDDKRGMVGYDTFKTAQSTLAHAVSRHDYIAGDRFTAADVYVGAHVGWGMQFGSLETCPEFEDYFARISGRAAFKRATELDDADAKRMEQEAGS